MFKNKKLLLIILLLIVVTVLIVVFSKDNSKVKVNSPVYKEVKEQIKKKDKFFVYVTNNELLEEDNFSKVLDYYKETYNFKFIEFNIDKISKDEYDEFHKIVNKEELSYPLPFMGYFEDGNIKMKANIEDEYALKSFLLEYKFIDKKYKTIDYLLDDTEFKKYINSSDSHVLFYAFNDKDIYEYRKKLLETNSKYWIMYQHRVRNIKSDEYMEKWLKLNKEGDYNLPVLLKFKNGKLIKKVDNINLDNIKDKIKEISK